MPCGIENSETLARYGVEVGNVDTVLSAQVLWFAACLLYRPFKPYSRVPKFGSDCHWLDRLHEVVSLPRCIVLIWGLILVGYRIQSRYQEHSMSV